MVENKDIKGWENKTIELEVGKRYKTRGGWLAEVIWENQTTRYPFAGFYAIHKPRTEDESMPIHHRPDGTSVTAFSVCESPTYGKHPADIIELIECIKKPETCGKCERLAKILGHPRLGYCIRGDCLIMLDNTQTNENEHCFVPRVDK